MDVTGTQLTAWTNKLHLYIDLFMNKWKFQLMDDSLDDWMNHWITDE